jgi:hypothetical protein
MKRSAIIPISISLLCVAATVGATVFFGRARVSHSRVIVKPSPGNAFQVTADSPVQLRASLVEDGVAPEVWNWVGYGPSFHLSVVEPPATLDGLFYIEVHSDFVYVGQSSTVALLAAPSFQPELRPIVDAQKHTIETGLGGETTLQRWIGHSKSGRETGVSLVLKVMPVEPSTLAKWYPPPKPITPYVVAALLGTALVSWFVWGIKGLVDRRGRARRELRGLCVWCGYDLLGEKKRCPECGKES